jgi:hypothetical protein
LPGDSLADRNPLLSYLDLDLDRKKLRLRPHPNFTPPVNARSVLAFNRSTWVVEESRSLWVWKSARHRIRIGAGIGADALNPRSLNIGSGRVIWVKGRTLRSFGLSTHRRTNRRLPRRGVRAAPVKRGAVVAIPKSNTGRYGDFRIRVVSID